MKPPYLQCDCSLSSFSRCFKICYCLSYDGLTQILLHNLNLVVSLVLWLGADIDCTNITVINLKEMEIINPLTENMYHYLWNWYSLSYVLYLHFYLGNMRSSRRTLIYSLGRECIPNRFIQGNISSSEVLSSHIDFSGRHISQWLTRPLKSMGFKVLNSGGILTTNILQQRIF